MKKWVFCSSLKSCFSFSSHTITRVIFRMNEIHYLENVSLNFQQQNNNKKFLSDRFSFLPSLLSTRMKKVRQKKTFTDEMQKNNSLFCNAKLAYCDKPSIKFGFLSSIKSGVFYFSIFLPGKKMQGPTSPLWRGPCILSMIFHEKYFSCYVLLTDHTLLSDCFYFLRY